MKNRFTILPLVIFILCSCQKNKESKTNTPTLMPFQAERNAFFSSLKTPAEVAAKLQATSAEFNVSLMNNTKEFTAYANNPIKAAANLGIYLSDLNYTVAYQQGSQTKELFTAAHELSKVIGIEQGILDFLMKRYSDNLTQNDSVKSVVNALFDKSTIGLQGTDRERLVGVSMAAYQIENLHLLLGVLESLPEEMLPDDKRTQALTSLYQMVIEEKSNVKITYGFLQSIADIKDPDKNPNYPYYGNAFKELIDVYNQLTINPAALKIISDDEIKELSAKVNTIRNKIISVE